MLQKVSTITKKSISLIIKPTDACNLRCKHCYAAETGYTQERMSLDVLRKTFDLFSKDFDEIHIIWHGGEPLLMGVEFFKNVLKIQKEYKNKKFINKMQSNVTLLTEEWLNILIENEIKLGISFDGQFNDVLRTGTSKVLRAINLMKSKNYEFGSICVVCSETVDKLIDIYEFFKCIGVSYKINPIFNSGEAKNNPLLGLSTDQYADRFLEFFEYWLSDTNCNIYVDYPLTYVSQFLGNKEILCTSTSCLTKWFGICANGDIYPCGRAYPEEYNIGNIQDFLTINDILLSDKYQNLLAGAIKRRETCMNNCPLFSRCRGGCNNDAILAGDITMSGFQECIIFKKIIPAIEDILKRKFNENLGEAQKLNPTIEKMKVNKVKSREHQII